MNKQISNQWIKLKFSEIGKLNTSSVDKKIQLNEQNVLLLNYMDVYRNNFISNKINFQKITATSKELESFKVNKGDIFFTPSSETPDDIGHSAVIVSELINTLQSYHLVKLKLNDEKLMDLNFRGYVFNSENILNQFRLAATGSTRFTISLKEFAKIEVYFPKSIPDQKKIASILTSVDDVIEKTQSKINKLQDLKKGTINKLLIKGIGHTEFKDSELGIVPKSWKIMELSKVSKILSSNVDKKTKENETSVLLCNYMDVYKNLKITREINFMKASAKKSEIDKFLIKKDDVIITKDSETPDDIAISSYVSENFDNVLCGYHLSIIRPNKSVLDGKFLNFFFKLDYMHHRFSILANGTTRFGLNLKEVENSKILIPELEEQKKIANIICSLEDKILIIKKKLNKYVFIKKSLMQDLLTGKVRVSVN
uniref:Putative Type I restriction modification DNA specificity domain protein n=1 Tax=uncultured marine microorganism HF4000_097M14 TaxID=455520 RepID=B3T1V2_9ZZZZ|nr:putative Type I restriction modification DNA specificity domain protein [uncultured marine microorganism HF4000_097M14]